MNASIVTGDGKTVLDKRSLLVEDGLISELLDARYAPYTTSDSIIDAREQLVIPGVINSHAHGITFGAFQPIAWEPLPEARVLQNLTKHLLQGTTTILNVDGLSAPWEIELINKIQPIEVKTCTVHSPANIRLAEVVAGYGLRDYHRKLTAEEMVKQGAVALGEVGTPSSTGGTIEKNRRLSRKIPIVDAKALDDAVLVEKSDEAIRRTLARIRFDDILTVDQARKLVHDTMVAPREAAREAIRDTVSYAKKLGVPMIAHNANDTADVVLGAADVLGRQLIASHTNHTFTPKEAVDVARQLRKRGGVIDILSGDMFGARQVENSPDVTFALFRERLVDVISTDYIGGYHDPILLVLQKAIEEKLLSVPEAIALTTSNPAKYFPRLAYNKGLLEPGRVADICIVERDDISKVRYVIINGRVIVKEGHVDWTLHNQSLRL